MFDFDINTLMMLIGIGTCLRSRDSIYKRTIIGCLYVIIFVICYHINFIYSLIIYCFIILLFICKNLLKNNYDSLTKVCESIEKSDLNNKELIIDYRKRIHENYNHLLIIKGMLNNSEYVEDYINTLIGENDNSNLDIGELSNLTYPGLKDFFRNKILKLCKMGADIEIYISDDVKNIKYNFDSKIADKLFTILGVLLDNMIDSVRFSERKLASILIYCESGYVCFELANTYEGYIDLESINKCGYSTKGDGRGVGLNIVQSIISNGEKFSLKSFIVDEFFSQKLYIKIGES